MLAVVGAAVLPARKAIIARVLVGSWWAVHQPAPLPFGNAHAEAKAQRSWWQNRQ